MAPLDALVHRLIRLHREGRPITLLAVCPNSEAVLEAAVKVAAANNMPMLFAATLNQVDRDGGYTGWTQPAFVARLRELAVKYACASPLYPCLDHGGPWLKDAHALAGLSLEETAAEVKASLEACLEAGYALLHIDPTVDRSLPVGQGLRIEAVVERTVELVVHAEAYRSRLGLPPISYEVGTEEVHGGLADMGVFDRFLSGLRSSLGAAGLSLVWPCFIVGKVGTDLHTTTFDPKTSHRLYRRVSPLGSLIKGHYTDWVANPGEYPASGMGAANVGPEFTATELAALRQLCNVEGRLSAGGSRLESSHFTAALESAVVRSGRWRKWLTPEETELPFGQLTPSRRDWLVATGARYIWTDPEVLAARRQLYDNLRSALPDPHGRVVDRIAANIQVYVEAFRLRNSLPLLSD